MQIDVKSILAFVVMFGLESIVTWNWMETRSLNSRAVPVTAVVTSEPQQGVEREQRKIRWIPRVERAGFHFDYRYQVAGTTYSGSGFQVEKPGASTEVYYDSADPSRSVAELKDGSLQLVFMIVLGLAVLYTATNVPWRALIGRA